MKRQIQTILATSLDILSAIVLGCYGLLIGPLGVLRGPLAINKTLWYMWVLAPQGLLTRAVHAAIDWRVGRFDAAIVQLESLVSLNESYFEKRPDSKSRIRILEDLYTLLARAYLHAGHIDDAMLVIIRAKKTMGVSRLSGLAELDAKTAHLVRAGLAAGRLLDGGGLATMFVKSSENKTPKNPSARQGASANPNESRKSNSDANDGKVIPFRIPHQPETDAET